MDVPVQLYRICIHGYLITWMDSTVENKWIETSEKINLSIISLIYNYEMMVIYLLQIDHSKAQGRFK